MYVSVQRVGGMFSGEHPPGSQILGSSAWQLPTQQTVMTMCQLHTLPSRGLILIVGRKYSAHHALSIHYMSDAVLFSFPGFSHRVCSVALRGRYNYLHFTDEKTWLRGAEQLDCARTPREQQKQDVSPLPGACSDKLHSPQHLSRPITACHS